MSTQRWRARVKLGNTNLHLGYFASDMEASGVYNQKVQELHGNYVSMNVGVEDLFWGDELASNVATTNITQSLNHTDSLDLFAELDMTLDKETSLWDSGFVWNNEYECLQGPLLDFDDLNMDGLLEIPTTCIKKKIISKKRSSTDASLEDKPPLKKLSSSCSIGSVSTEGAESDTEIEIKLGEKLKRTSDFRGVSCCGKDRKWQARLRIGKVVHYLGRFPTEIHAAIVYDQKVRELKGDHAPTNFQPLSAADQMELIEVFQHMECIPQSHYKYLYQGKSAKSSRKDFAVSSPKMNLRNTSCGSLSPANKSLGSYRQVTSVKNFSLSGSKQMI